MAKIPVMISWCETYSTLLNPARHLGVVLESPTAPPPPPVTTKLKIYPSNILQNPPYCTNLQLIVIIQNSGGRPPQPAFPIHSTPNINSSSILQGVKLTYFENTPVKNSTPRRACSPAAISAHCTSLSLSYQALIYT